MCNLRLYTYFQSSGQHHYEETNQYGLGGSVSSVLASDSHLDECRAQRHMERQEVFEMDQTWANYYSDQTNLTHFWASKLSGSKIAPFIVTLGVVNSQVGFGDLLASLCVARA